MSCARPLGEVKTRSLHGPAYGQPQARRAMEGVRFPVAAGSGMDAGT